MQQSDRRVRRSLAIHSQIELLLLVWWRSFDRKQVLVTLKRWFIINPFNRVFE